MSIVESITTSVLEGKICNIVGLPGSGRTTVLQQTQVALEDLGFEVHLLDASVITRQSFADARSTLRAYVTNEKYRAFLVDSCDLINASSLRRHLDRILASIVLSDSIDRHRLSRLVFASSPRCRDLSGPSPNPRERALPFVLPSEGTDRPRILHAQDLPALIGTLRNEHHVRLSKICNAQTGTSTWREDLDPIMIPIISQLQTGDVWSARVAPERRDNLLSMLFSEPWPDQNVQKSARRLRARCGLDRNVLWVDPYLGDDRKAPLTALGAFLDVFFEQGMGPRQLQILSRRHPDVNYEIDPNDLANSLRNTFGTRAWFNRLHWRLFSGRHGGAHDRHLLLLGYEEVYSLPPADRVIGIRRVTNEIDGIIGSGTFASEIALWRRSDLVI